MNNNNNKNKEEKKEEEIETIEYSDKMDKEYNIINNEEYINFYKNYIKENINIINNECFFENN